ncbi:helix-turn-helix transcriptional regulator [Undibacterium jejuense]|uniref:Helix-turn-helix transcriptional regulator n=1 Tax=Undibacterium jejuense TaxID=1344949 RepID=A0A923KQ45_9BURK|nr:helix-turn-helix transcriptional regulator [Undibacterium jejuense]MBC3863503.1 helix-turn-helix transcriptional regulator [Undibacterium jejuense]
MPAIDLTVVKANKRHSLRQVSSILPALCLVKHGTKQVIWDEQFLDIESQQLLLFPAGMKFTVSNIPDKDLYLAEMVSVPPQLISRFRQRYGDQLLITKRQPLENNLRCKVDTHTTEAWRQLMASIAAQAPDSLQEHYLEGVLLALSLNNDLSPIISIRADTLCERIQHLIALRPAYEWSTTKIAQQLHIGESTLRRRLQAEGKKFGQILLEVRFGQALNLLQTTSKAIGEIAIETGYASASRFSHRFRSHYGITPSELRKSM